MAAAIRRRDVEAYIADLLERCKPGTAVTRYQDLRVLFGWMVDEEEIATSPMARMKPPILPEVPVPVLSATEQRALLATCGGKEFDDRRDTAIIRLFLDTGMRLAELGGLSLDDLDLDQGVAVVLGKGRRVRACPFGARTSQALDRYLRSRERHRLGALPDTWLTRFGPMTGSAIAQMVRRRGQQAGIAGLHPHVLRHTFAHAWLESWQRGRPDAPRRLAQPQHARPLCGLDRRRARPGCPPAALARRPSLTRGPSRAWASWLVTGEARCSVLPIGVPSASTPAARSGI